MKLSDFNEALGYQITEEHTEVVVRIDDSFWHVTDVETTDHGVTLVCDREIGN